ncbi:MAG: ADP-forming succinate--CoA ligase subunit beta [Oligoflexus sp.]|nr:ADP-forming succinate--CoA ligase subunit beta [Oligoflexus sp.]
MDIHEYQAKQLFKQNGIPVPEGYLATNPLEAEFAMRRLGTEIAVVKAQVHAGGRGKGGGVKLAKTPEEAAKLAKEMIGMTLVTHQTGPEGKKVHKVYVEAGSKIVKEYYLALVLDRETAGIGFMFSTEGGMDIEEVAEKTPEKIVYISVDPTTGLQGHHIRSICFQAKLPPAEHKELTPILKNLYKMFLKYDYAMLEINPLIINDQGKMFVLDGKMNFDDNAMYRQKDIEVMRDFLEEDPREVQASKYGLSYIGLDGNIGCLVNGAGLAMATMDITKFFGGSPANFLDVGGGANQETVTNAFKILLSDSNVKGIFVNIFGGIMRCDVIANGIVAAAKELGLRIPMVVRLEGTNVEQGKEILKSSGLDLYAASDMADGAKKIVEMVKKK